MGGGRAGLPTILWGNQAMHVAVFADIEGSFGIWRMRQCRTGTSEWQYGRLCLTDDVNHVIQGAFDGGARQVTVKDTHDTGFNCIIGRLDKRAGYIGGHFSRPTLFGRVAQFDLVLYVAIHAASGTRNAFFPHTHSGVYSEVRINGRLACEMDIYGGYLGELGVPVGFVSGEEVAVGQAREWLPWAESVAVDKNKKAYTSGEKSAKYLSEGRLRLRQTAAKAVREAARMKPLIVRGPLHFAGEFRTEELARKLNTWGFYRSGRRVEWEAETMTEGMDKLNRLTFLSRRMYPLRRPLMFFSRRFSYVRHTYFAPRPNFEDAAVEI